MTHTRVTDVEDLYEAMRNDPKFDLLRRGQNPLVPGEGLQPAGVMIVGEAPGADEVMALRPFVGASGRVLRSLMSLASLRTGDDPNCWLTNTVKYRPPRNRTPIWPEIEASRPYLLKECILVGDPRVVVAVGAVSLSAIVGKPTSIVRWAGKPRTSKTGRTLWPMFHPAYGMRAGDDVKLMIEQHWQKFAEWLDENGTR